MKRSQFLAVLEIAEILFIALAAVFIVKSYVAQPFVVQGSSMEPNFGPGDYLLVDELSPRFESLKTGEVVVFRYPQDPSEFFIKRIIGLPGDKVTIENGRVYVNGKELSETYLPQGTETCLSSSYSLDSCGNETVDLTADQYFVMGDNRAVSYDSRSWGPVAANLMMGVVRVRLLPPTEFKIFSYSSANQKN
ncbi:MAG TPA: signal peptidase I [Candidatus Tyrphobacter sp.]|nr:signal peptidase I [Candidatus Tyrphobacter sp.]